MDGTAYTQQQYEQTMIKIRDLIKTSPSFIGEFVRGIENTTSILTRLNYVFELRLFLTFLCEERLPDKSDIKDITIDDIDLLTSTDIELYLEYLSLYSKNDKNLRNNECAKARKLSAIRSMYKYFFKKQKITHNPSALIDTPKIHKKAIIRLEADEVERILQIAESGENLSTRQKKFHELTKTRDVALLTLLLGTGIRVSELVGLDVDDIDFMTNDFLVTRKGGNQEILAFGDEVRMTLRNYMLIRETILPAQGHEGALFLSLQNKRINVRTVEKLVKKYAAIAAPLKKISPHKLRSTYGTMLYQETGDIYLVAEVLGHKDVNTTKKHYAAMSMDRKRMAAEVIKLSSKSQDYLLDDEDISIPYPTHETEQTTDERSS